VTTHLNLVPTFGRRVGTPPLLNTSVSVISDARVEVFMVVKIQVEFCVVTSCNVVAG